MACHEPDSRNNGQDKDHAAYSDPYNLHRSAQTNRSIYSLCLARINLNSAVSRVEHLVEFGRVGIQVSPDISDDGVRLIGHSKRFLQEEVVASS